MKMRHRMPAALSDQEIDRIIHAARELVSDIPLRCTGTDEFNDYLSAYGCEVGPDSVRFPKSVVERTFCRIDQERTKRLAERDSDRAAELPLMEMRSEEGLVGGVSGQAGVVHAVDGPYRACTKDDLAHYSRMIDSFPEIEWHHPCMIPQDAPVRTREVHAYATIILNNTKPRLTSVYSKEGARVCYNISRVAYGSDEAARANAPFIHTLWINTPFSISRDVIEGAMEVRRLLGRPFKITSMPVAGASTPVTLAGSLALGAAEIIIQNIISLALDDRLNGLFLRLLTMDVRHGLAVYGPEEKLVKLGAAQIARQMFGYVSHAFALGCSANSPGAQSMMEKTMGAMFALQCGAQVLSAMGTLALSDTISPVQFLLDYELLQYLSHIERGIEVSDYTLALDEIRRVAPSGAAFLGSDHTLDNYATHQWFPEFMDRRSAMSWMRNPGDMVENACARAQILWETAENRCPLDAGQRREIESILEGADRQLG